MRQSQKAEGNHVKLKIPLQEGGTGKSLSRPTEMSQKDYEFFLGPSGLNVEDEDEEEENKSPKFPFMISGNEILIHKNIKDKKSKII